MANIVGATSGEFVNVGDEITREDFLRGHGTMPDKSGTLVATVSGFVHRVNKLVSVRAQNARYHAEIGDVVVGRVAKVADRKWRVDINARQDAVLMLSSIILPGGVQRRRTYEDSLQMRQFFVEGDLLSAEVQTVLSDGAVSLHARSTKYGKLSRGCFFVVPPGLIKRSKQHFLELSCGVSVILGNNGYIWVSIAKETGEAAAINQQHDETTAVSEPLTTQQRELISRVRNSIIALAESFLPISESSVMQVYNESVRLGVVAKDVVGAVKNGVLV